MATFKDKLTFANGITETDGTAQVVAAITNLDATLAASETPAFDCNSATLATSNDAIGNIYKILIDAGIIRGTVTTV